MNFNIMKQYNTILISTETHYKAKKVATNSQIHRQFRSLQPHLVPYGKRESKVLDREEDCQDSTYTRNLFPFSLCIAYHPQRSFLPDFGIRPR